MIHLLKSLKNGEATVALISIKPQFALKLFSGDKQYEFRRRKVREDLKWALVYASAPIKKIIGILKISEVKSSSPTLAWNTAKNMAGISRRDFRIYFKGCKIAWAIRIEKAINFTKPLCLSEIDPLMRAPQSLVYVNNAFLNSLLHKSLPYD